MPTDIRYDLSQLFDLAFGVKSPVFLPYPLQVTPGASPQFTQQESGPIVRDTFPNIEVKEQPAAERYSWMGTPIVFPFTLKGGTYKVFNGDGDLVDYQIADFEMPAATLVDFTRPKIITRTKIPGNKGTVKELYGFDDWTFRIRGLCLDDQSRNTAKTAAEQKRELLKWNEICNAVNVTGELFFEKNIHALSINNINFTQLERKPNVFPFEFECYSDDRLELIL